MDSEHFKALVVRETEDQNFTRKIEEKSFDALPENDVLIQVYYSSLNYKDALSASGNKGVTRHYPHTPGIDSAGIVRESADPEIQPGDEVIVHGYDLGMNTDGGFAQYIRVSSDWVVPVPSNLTLRESMMFGTAGFTAAMCLRKLEAHAIDYTGKVLVTGATGGVGSFAVALLAKEGYHVVAATGKAEQHEFLKSLGATEIIDRDSVIDSTGKPLLRRKWAGVVDTVGGDILSTAIRSTDSEGAVTSCGNAASHQLQLTVYPFILRGVSLLGVDSANYPMSIRRQIWEKLANKWKLEQLDQMVAERSLDELNDEIDRILKGQQVGRILINLQK